MISVFLTAMAAIGLTLLGVFITCIAFIVMVEVLGRFNRWMEGR